MGRREGGGGGEKELGEREGGGEEGRERGYNSLFLRVVDEQWHRGFLFVCLFVFFLFCCCCFLHLALALLQVLHYYKRYIVMTCAQQS